MKRIGKWLAIFGVVALVIITVFAISPFGRLLLGFIFMQRNVPFDRPHLQAVVEKIKTKNLKPGDHPVELRLENINDPESLRARKTSDNDRGRGAGSVWVSREPGGELVVIIETQDNGHAGTYGYAYSEIEPTKLRTN